MKEAFMIISKKSDNKIAYKQAITFLQGLKKEMIQVI